MLRYRKVLLIASVVGVVGSLSTTLGYALHLRGNGYRRSLEAKLSRKLQMHLSIGSVEPLSLSSRRLNDLRVRTRRQPTEVFACDRAVWRQNLQNGRKTYALDLEDGWLVVGTRTWGPDEYRDMLKTGLGHDFAALGLTEIRLSDIDLRWMHPRAQFVAERTSGAIYFDDSGTGRATLFAPCLNGIEVGTPIRISAHFTPGPRLQFHEVVLNVPESPLSTLNPDAFVGGNVTQGRFTGTVRYRGPVANPEVTVSGAVSNALLRELTRALPGGPYDGRADVVVDEARFGESSLRALRFAGELNDLDLGQLLPAMTPPLTGRLALRVHQAVYEQRHIRYFSGEGRATEVSLAALTGVIGRGRVTGTLEVMIHSLLVVDDQLVLADVTLDATPDAGSEATIDRDMLRTVSTRALGFDATVLLPSNVQDIDYTHLGVRLELNRNELRVHGTHGEEGKTILTVNILDHEFGIIDEPSRTFKVDDLVGQLRRHLDEYDTERIRRWWLSRPSDSKPRDD